MVVNEYIQHWNYYCSLASRLEETKNYVYHGLIEEENDNLKFIHGTVYSDIFKQIIILAASEFEIVAKALCKEIGKEAKNIVDISTVILGQYPKLVEIQIGTEFWQGMPLQNWKIDENGDVKGIDWWRAYNSLKHNEVDSYKNATLENAVLSLATLYAINLYLMHKVFGSLSIAYTYPCVYFKSKYIGSPVKTGEGLLPDYGNKSALEIFVEEYPEFFAEKKQKTNYLK